ncbi:MAG TPA: hypothetical protein ENH65_00405, partial [Candidatus Aminicenantes bacterium]|nr:hypothetical protein [Candidatus Aminicenantes bacterium]
MPDNRKLLYQALKDKQLYNKTEGEFNVQFDSPEKQAMLHQAMQQKGLYSKGEQSFMQQFFEVDQRPIEELLDTQKIETNGQPKTIEAQQPEVFAGVTGPTQEKPLEEQVKEQPTAKPSKSTDPAKLSRTASFLANINQRFYGLPGEVLKAIGIGGAKISSLITGEEQDAQEGSTFYKVGQWYQDAIEELAPTNPEYQGELQESVGAAIGDLAGLVTGGGIARAATKAPQMLKLAKKAGLPVVEAIKNVAMGVISPEGLIGATQMGVSEYEQAKEGGATDDESFELFLKNAAVGSVLERIPVQLFWKRLDTATGGGVKLLLKKGLTGGIEEGTTEIMQQAYSNKSAQEVYDETRTIVDGMGEAGGIGFGLGFVLNAMGVRLRGLKKAATEPKDIEALTNAEQIVEKRLAEIKKNTDEILKIEKDATKEREIPESDQLQHPEAPEGELPTKTERSDSPDQSGEIKTETQPEEKVTPDVPVLKTKAGNEPNHAGVFISDDVEKIELKNKRKDWKGASDADVRIVQLENDKWVATASAQIGSGGFGSAPSINDKQYETRDEAIAANLNQITNWLNKNINPYSPTDVKAADRAYKWIQETYPKGKTPPEYTIELKKRKEVTPEEK